MIAGHLRPFFWDIDIETFDPHSYPNYTVARLSFFEDAQSEPMPKMLAPISWEEVTAFFRNEAPKLV